MTTETKVEAVVFDRDAIFRSAEARAKLYALTLLVEGPGCIRWEDGNGFRLKDTAEWVQFYCLVKDMQNFTFKDESSSAITALEGEVERLRAIEAAARTYYREYCQDEAGDELLNDGRGMWTGATAKQISDAAALRDALTKESP